MAEVNAGSVVGVLKIDTSALDALDARAQKSGAALKSGLSDKVSAIGGDFQKLGKAGGEGIDAIRAASSKAESSLLSAKGATSALTLGLAEARAAAAAFGVTLSAAAAIGLGTKIFSDIGRLQDLSEQTRIPADRLAAIKPIVDNAGSSIETFAVGIRSLQREMATGMPDVIAAMHDLGIAGDDMKRLSADPVAAIDALSKGLANIENQGKSTAVVMEVLSRAGYQLVPALREINKAGGVAKLESPITKEQIAAIDDAGDKLHTLWLKGEAYAAIYFVGVINGFKDIANYVTSHPIDFIFNTKGGVTDIVARGKQLRTDVAAATKGAQLGGAGGIVGEGPGLAELKSQTDFKKALDEQILSLKTQKLALTDSAEASANSAAQLVITKAQTIDLTQADAKFAEQLKALQSELIGTKQAQLGQSLIQANQGLQVQITTMTRGAEAGEKLAHQYAIDNAHLNDMGEAARKASAQFEILTQRKAEAAVVQILNTRETAQNVTELKQQEGGSDFNAAAKARDDAQKAIDSLNDIIADKFANASAKKLAIEAKLLITPQLDENKLAAIDQQIAIDSLKAVRTGDILNKLFANSFDVAAAKIEALKGQLSDAFKADKGEAATPTAHAVVVSLGVEIDDLQLEKALSDIERDLTVAANQSLVFGRSFDLAGANVSTIQGKISDLLKQGLSPLNAEVQELGTRLQAAKAAQVFSDLQRSMENVVGEAAVLGGAVNAPAEAITNLTSAIKKLIDDGLDPLDPKITRLKSQLEDARAAQRWADAFTGMGDAFRQAIDDLSNGGKLKDVLKNLAGRINSELTKALVTEPLQKKLQELLNQFTISSLPDIFGKKLPTGFGERPAGVEGPSLPGGFFSTKQGADAAAAVATKGSDTAAIAAIQAESTTATTAIQALSTQGTAAIQAALTTGTTSIEAVKDVAIAAIQAQQTTNIPGSGGSPSFPSIGNLFGGSQTGYGSAPPGVEGPALANGGFFSNPLGAAFSAISSFLPKFAEGGGMSALDTGIIGERGPEIWKPDTAGRVIPLSKIAEEMGLSGKGSKEGDTFVANVTVHATDAGSFHGSERQIANAIELALRRGREG